MPTQLSQILALEQRARAKAVQSLAEVLQVVAKDGPWNGSSRKYSPKVIDGPEYPPESTRVQITVTETTKHLADSLGRWWDITATRDRTNTEAKANVVVDGVTLLSDAPAPFLVWFEKQLIDVRRYFAGLPVLDPAEEWNLDENVGLWRTPPVVRNKTTKVFKNHEVSPATKEHPAKVHVYEDDEIEGTWEVTKLSGAVQATDRDDMVARLDKLIEAVTIAREEANRTPVTDLKVGDAVFEYLLGN